MFCFAISFLITVFIAFLHVLLLLELFLPLLLPLTVLLPRSRPYETFNPFLSLLSVVFDRVEAISQASPHTYGITVCTI